LGRIKPSTVLAEQHAPGQASRDQALEAVNKKGVWGIPTDPVVLDPGAHTGHLQVEGKVGLGIGVDPDETVGGYTHGCQQRELVAHHPCMDGMATDHRAGDQGSARRRA
jgi:hypothetical protein